MCLLYWCSVEQRHIFELPCSEASMHSKACACFAWNHTMPGPDSENWMGQMFLVSLRRVYEAFYFSPCLYIQLSARWFLRSTSIMRTCTSTPLISPPFPAAPFIIYWQLLGCSLACSISIPALVLKEFPVHCFQVGLKNIIPSAQILFRLAAFPLRHQVLTMPSHMEQSSN